MSEAPNPTPAPTPDPTPAPAAWFAGAAPEVIGVLQSKGWHDKTPTEAAIAAVTSYSEAQKFIGVPPEQIVKLPKDAADEAGWKAAWTRLGVPADAKDYDFSSLKNEDGTPKLAADREAFLRATAHKLNIPKEAAVQLAQELLANEGGVAIAAAAEKTAKLAEEHKTLDASWGQNKENNTFLARKGAEKLGLDAGLVDAMESVVGYEKVMQALLKVGQTTMEASFIGDGTGPSGKGVLTREQASARKAELMADKAWADRYLNGDVTANREMTALIQVIAGD